jgi:hypothetical protein
MTEYSKDFRPDYEDMVALGQVPGVMPVNKYGRSTNVDATATDIWDLTATQPIWLAPTAARIHAIVSSSGDDTLAGVGAKTVRIFGLVSWNKKEVWEDIEMAGATPVNTINSYVIIHRMKVLTWGTSGPNAGIIKATAASDSTITAQILAGAGQTQMAIYGIPSIQKLLLEQLYADMNKAGGLTPLADMSLQVNTYPQSVSTNFVVKHTFGLVATGNSRVSELFTPPKLIEGPAVLKVQALGSTTDLDISAGFNGKLYLNN